MPQLRPRKNILLIPKESHDGILWKEEKAIQKAQLASLLENQKLKRRLIKNYKTRMDKKSIESRSTFIGLSQKYSGNSKILLKDNHSSLQMKKILNKYHKTSKEYSNINDNKSITNHINIKKIKICPVQNQKSTIYLEPDIIPESSLFKEPKSMHQHKIYPNHDNMGNLRINKKLVENKSHCLAQRKYALNDSPIKNLMNSFLYHLKNDLAFAKPSSPDHNKFHDKIADTPFTAKSQLDLKVKQGYESPKTNLFTTLDYKKRRGRPLKSSNSIDSESKAHKLRSINVVSTSFKSNECYKVLERPTSNAQQPEIMDTFDFLSWLYMRHLPEIPSYLKNIDCYMNKFIKDLENVA